jgi:uncharacterized protein YjiS (DUF1127 family)
MQATTRMFSSSRASQRGIAGYLDATVAKVKMRQTIRALSALSDRELKDIGLCHADLQGFGHFPVR